MLANWTIYNTSFLSSSFTNKVLVNDELPDGQMVDQWEPISFNSVQTPHEVYPREMFSYLCIVPIFFFPYTYN